MSRYKFQSPFFTEDARGRWYLNVIVEIEPVQSTGLASLGSHLGCERCGH
ncbi:hypothetical protein [Shewanella aestuarii]|uniref:Uncharacterized protein n=1 Tax=Shewanella aestuarii TaxID=1028752 RepID=A0A6G9QL05_9GAMM|nr:hypothetical protein [Shewanella aestuarii]QIR15152.1 hypothetical protein HBH39_12195 [Shewanella aestuarii]